MWRRVEANSCKRMPRPTCSATPSMLGHHIMHRSWRRRLRCRSTAPQYYLRHQHSRVVGGINDGVVSIFLKAEWTSSSSRADVDSSGRLLEGRRFRDTGHGVLRSDGAEERDVVILSIGRGARARIPYGVPLTKERAVEHWMRRYISQKPMMRMPIEPFPVPTLQLKAGRNPESAEEKR